ncbi:HMCN2 [Branchiostoma lanceolatum]|uniref:HMCN2 protein n=1 Tax=Branchiostoma lanceolatum TaxID=7740 RepID=A0A8J9ZDJ0_BRALA|nr:HMCN2 [Branchiostoma lanceolatum]
MAPRFSSSSASFLILLVCHLILMESGAAQIYKEAGQNVNLTCDYAFSGISYILEWRRGDEHLLDFFSNDSSPTFNSTDLSGRLSLQGGKNLIISNLNRTDDGRYYCRVSEEGVSPRVTLSPSGHATTTTGSDVTLNCTVDSKPDANITWTGPNGDLGTGNSVMLNNFQPAKDTGIYTCTATNSFSATKSASGYVVLTVQGAAQVYKEAGESVTLSCDYAFSGRGIRYTIEWHRDEDGERLLNFFSEDSSPTFDNTELSSRLSLQGGKHLVISNLQRTDDGRYYCKVSEIGGNPGDDGSDQNLVVTVSPSVAVSTLEQLPVTAATGSDVTLTCTITDSKPEANITWTGPNGDLGTENSVLLNNVQPANDTGTYTCTATNKANTERQHENVSHSRAASKRPESGSEEYEMVQPSSQPSQPIASDDYQELRPAIYQSLQKH